MNEATTTLTRAESVRIFQELVYPPNGGYRGRELKLRERIGFRTIADAHT